MALVLRKSKIRTISSYLDRQEYDILRLDRTYHGIVKYSRAKPPPPVSLTSFKSSVAAELGPGMGSKESRTSNSFGLTHVRSSLLSLVQ